MEVEYPFRVRVFPSNEWQISNLPLRLEDLKRHVYDVLRDAGIPSIPQGLEYHVYVLNNLPSSTSEVALSDMKRLDTYQSYVDDTLSESLSRALNGIEAMPVLERRDYQNKWVFIMSTPQSIARNFYEVPLLPTTAGYTITIFKGKEEEIRQLNQFRKSVEDANQEGRLEAL